MESLVVAFILALVAAIGYVGRDRSLDGVEVSLCLTCVNAIISRGTRGEERVACTYGAALRPVDFTVCECTGYCGKRDTSKLVKIEGFAREGREVYEEVAIS
ncbi:MAG: hypothetical protein WAN69_18835 [Candidatus Korobacteraceae bacterium]